MNDTSIILDAWIMLEHLTEGDINPKSKKYLRFDDFDFECGDYYDYFMHKIVSKWSSKRYKNGGIVFYIDIFPMQDLLNFIHSKFKLGKAGEEEIKGTSKFYFALYFDC